MKHPLLLALLLASALAQAAPTLLSDPYPAGSIQPTGAVFTINGGAPQPCALVAVAGGLQPKCDLVSIAVPGTYTLVLTVSSVAGCTAHACTGAGSASSAPFSYQWLGASATPPVVRLAP